VPDFTAAIIVLERETHAYANMERTLNRQLKVFPPESKQYLGAKTALDEVKGRILSLNAGIKALKHQGK
jgi:hypothetical protein